jgi:hypothetical protein
MRYSVSRRILWLAVLGLTMVALAPAGYARSGKCFLQVRGIVYLNSKCEIKKDSKLGTFSVGRGQTKRSKYFAMVDIDPSSGAGRGFWNGTDATAHAQEEIGILIKQGTCWVDDIKNPSTKICGSAK